MSIRNRELSQFGSFIYIEDSTKGISIAGTETPYIGIGTTSPQYKFHVVGVSSFNGNTSINGSLDLYGGINFKTQQGISLSGNVEINSTGIITAASFYNTTGGILTTFDSWSSSGTNIYRILGNVGIATDNPTEKLEIIGNVKANQFISTTTTSSPFTILNSNTSTNLVQNLNADFLRGGIPGSNINSNDIVTLGASQTLTNKTLTTPVFGSSGVTFNGSTSGTTILRASSNASGTLSLPVTNGTLVSTGDTGVITSSMIADLNITNIDVAIGASISYSKLSLTNSITNADISSSAGIANSKLSNSTISGVSLGSSLSTLTRGTYLTGSNYNGSSASTWAVDATSSNTGGASKIVARDGSGNFESNTITLFGNLTANSGTVQSQTLVANGSTESTSTGTGSLRITGGAGVSGNLYVGKNVVVGSGLSISGISTFSNLIRNTNTTNSTSTSTGALVVSGGVGIGSSVYIGGNLTVNGLINGGYQILHIQDQKSDGVSGGTFSASAWRTRTLNTTLTNTISGASLASNQITLPSGTYEINASVPAYAVDSHQSKFQNITTGISTVYGTSEYADSGAGGDTPAQTRSFIRGVFTITGIATYQIQHYSSTTGTFGNPVSFGGPEIYTDVFIRKLV